MLWYYTALWNTVEKLYLEYGFADVHRECDGVDRESMC
jgi:hypothetical protein